MLCDISFMSSLILSVNKYKDTSYEMIRLAGILRFLPIRTSAHVMLSYYDNPTIIQDIIRTNTSCNIVHVMRKTNELYHTKEAYRKKIINRMISQKTCIDVSAYISDFTVDLDDLLKSNSIYD